MSPRLFFSCLFADDTVPVADGKRNFERLVEEFGRVCKMRQLRMNKTNSTVMLSVRDCLVE